MPSNLEMVSLNQRWRLSIGAGAANGSTVTATSAIHSQRISAIYSISEAKRVHSVRSQAYIATAVTFELFIYWILTHIHNIALNKHRTRCQRYHKHFWYWLRWPAPRQKPRFNRPRTYIESEPCERSRITICSSRKTIVFFFSILIESLIRCRARRSVNSPTHSYLIHSPGVWFILKEIATTLSDGGIAVRQ